MYGLIRKNLRLWGYGKAAALFLGCLIFSISGRLDHGISYEQHILSAVSDHYYLTYFMLPILLLSCFSFLEDDGIPVISRFHSYHAYFLGKWLGTWAAAFLLTAVQTTAILLSGMGLPFGDQWGLPAGAAETELFSMLQQIFPAPVQAFLVCTLYQFAGSWLIFGICMWIGHFAGRRGAVPIISGLYMLSAVWLKLPAVQNLPFTGFGHLLILHHNLGGHYRFAATGVTFLLLPLAAILSLRFWWRGLPHIQLRGRGMAAYYVHELMIRKNLLILFGVVFGITLYKGMGHSHTESGTEWIYTLFAGHGTGYFQVLPFIEQWITGGAPLYLLAVFVEHTVSGQSVFVSVRGKSCRSLMRGILSAGTKFIGIYTFLWMIGGLLGAAFIGCEMEGPAWNLLLYAVLMKFLDIYLQYLFMLCIYLFTKQVSVSFLILAAGNLLCVLPGALASCLPFGLSGLMRISLMHSGIGVSAVTAFGILVSFSLLLTVWLAVFGCRKILD
nr:hypothetical protein [uncultured Blautia sp.]